MFALTPFALWPNEVIVGGNKLNMTHNTPNQSVVVREGLHGRTLQPRRYANSVQEGLPSYTPHPLVGIRHRGSLAPAPVSLATPIEKYLQAIQ